MCWWWGVEAVWVVQVPQSSSLDAALWRQSKACPVEELYNEGLVDKADGKAVVNRIRCAFMPGTYRESQKWRGQCKSPSHGRVFCKWHEHENVVSGRALALLCCLKRSPLREVLEGDRSVVTAFLARCLFEEDVGPEVAEVIDLVSDSESD